MAMGSTPRAGTARWIPKMALQELRGHDSCRDRNDGVTGQHIDGGQHFPYRGNRDHIPIAHSRDRNDGVVDANWNIGEVGPFLSRLHQIHQSAGEHGKEEDGEEEYKNLSPAVYQTAHNGFPPPNMAHHLQNTKHPQEPEDSNHHQ